MERLANESEVRSVARLRVWRLRGIVKERCTRVDGLRRDELVAVEEQERWRQTLAIAPRVGKTSLQDAPGAPCRAHRALKNICSPVLSCSDLLSATWSAEEIYHQTSTPGSQSFRFVHLACRQWAERQVGTASVPAQPESKLLQHRRDLDCRQESLQQHSYSQHHASSTFKSSPAALQNFLKTSGRSARATTVERLPFFAQVCDVAGQ